jgi:hypothetical protein
MRDDVMPLLSDHQIELEHIDGLIDRIRDAHAVTPELIATLVETTCRRIPSVGQSDKTTRLERLIQSGAWTDVALALIDLELPQWQVRRIAYDEGEWHCALSRERELPEWLDQSMESRHADLPLAILGAFIDARRASVTSNRTSVPAVPHHTSAFYEPNCCDNFA